jgi:hypothetical protein
MMQIGETVKRMGYVTTYGEVKRKSGAQLEGMLAYKASSKGEGWALLYLIRRPDPNDLEFDSIAHLLAGVPRTMAKGLPVKAELEQMLKDDGAALEKLKEKIIDAAFTFSGGDRICKVVPNKEPDRKLYKLSLNYAQWELTSKLVFKVAALIAPGGKNWETADVGLAP